eukprot:scaffold590955_cov24-Prasinocladus_malaysianus.AAC.1
MEQASNSAIAAQHKCKHRRQILLGLLARLGLSSSTYMRNARVSGTRTSHQHDCSGSLDCSSCQQWASMASDK